MRIWLIALMGVLALSFLPAPGRDLGKLEPVSALYIYMYEGNVVVETDAGDLGSGKTLEAALEDLHAGSMGEIFLDTAEHLILTDASMPLLPELEKILRPSVEPVVGKNGMDLKKAERYLSAHPTGATLLKISTQGKQVPRLFWKEGRFRIEG